MASRGGLLTNAREKFEKARRLIEEESKKDPETEPYKSKYAAKEILLDLKSELKKAHEKLSEAEGDRVNRITCLMAVLDYYLGMIYIETDELSTGEEHLCHCLETLSKFELEAECIIAVMNSLNQLGYLWSRRNKPEKSQEYLERAEKLHRKYVKEIAKPPYDMSDLFLDKVTLSKLEGNFQKLESILTHTLYYLAQVYSSLGETVKAAMYCHSTLRRQLESKEYDPIDWALNCATMSQFFVSREEMYDARHHLACSTCILDQYESELHSKEESKEDLEAKLEVLKHRKADVARCWAKYAEILLTASKDHLYEMAAAEEQEVEEVTQGTSEMQLQEQKPTEASHSEPNQDLSCSKSKTTHLKFKSLEVTSTEEQITADNVLDYQQARDVFLNGQKWLNQAKEFYTLDTHASDYIQISQQMSTLYKLLAFFESNLDRQCKMHKRRIDLLEGCLKELNPQYYLYVCRQLQFELGEIYSDMMDIKSTMLREGDMDASAHTLKKINYLAEQSIKYFQQFINTFKDSNEKLPDKIPEELLRPVLLAHFFIGRLYGKLITRDLQKELGYMKSSLDFYEYVANYCEENKEAEQFMKSELEVCVEMVKLLPMKMEKLLIASP